MQKPNLPPEVLAKMKGGAVPVGEDKIPLFLDPKPDMTPEEAACIALVVCVFAPRGIVPEKYSGHSIAWSKEIVDPIFDRAWRHFAPKPELVEAINKRLEERGQPEPRIDENGKKHYSMSCDAGHFGLKGGSATGKKE